MVTRLSSWNDVGEGESEVDVGGWVTKQVRLLMVVIWKLDRRLFVRLGDSDVCVIA